MSDQPSSGRADDHPLNRLARELSGIRGLLARFADAISEVAVELPKWTLVFRSDGTLVGGVDRRVWEPSRDGIADLPLYAISRQERLVEAGVLTESHELDSGHTFDGEEWEQEARELGLVLPKLIRPVSLEAIAYEEAWELKRLHQEWDLEQLQADVPIRRRDGAELLGPEVPRFQGLPSHFDLDDAKGLILLSQLQDNLESCLDFVGWLRERLTAADDAVKSLPPNVLEALDGLDRLGWRARFRKQVLMPVGGWREARDGRLRAFPGTLREAVFRIQSYHPGPDWTAHTLRIDEALDDLRAVASEVDADPSPEFLPRLIDDPEWSFEMSKTEAGRLLGCKGDDRTCRDHLTSLMAGETDMIKSRSSQKHRFRIDWVRSIEPKAVERFRPR